MLHFVFVISDIIFWPNFFHLLSVSRVYQILLMHFLPLCFILSLFKTSQLFFEQHWVIFLFLSILFAKSRLSFNLLQGKEAKYIFLKKDSVFLLKPCVPSCLCQVFIFFCLTESWLFSITECFDFCFSLPIFLNFIIPWYIFRFPQWRSNKPLSCQCFSYPGMTVTLSTPPVSQRKEQKKQAAGKVITDL